MTAAVEARILRYRPRQRLVHWLGVGTVLTLLVTGLALLWPPLGFIAWGGVGPLLHRVGAVVFMALPFAYALLNPRQTAELLVEIFTYDREDWAWLKHFPGYFLGHAVGLPPQGRLNAGQKLHHAGTFLAFITVSLSGLVLWFLKGSLGATWLPVVAMVHDVSMLAVTVLLVGHVYFTFVYDALPAMTTGYVSEEYARLEHAKWLEELTPAEPVAETPETEEAPAIVVQRA